MDQIGKAISRFEQSTPDDIFVCGFDKVGIIRIDEAHGLRNAQTGEPFEGEVVRFKVEIVIKTDSLRDGDNNEEHC